MVPVQQRLLSLYEGCGWLVGWLRGKRVPVIISIYYTIDVDGGSWLVRGGWVVTPCHSIPWMGSLV